MAHSDDGEGFSATSLDRENIGVRHARLLLGVAADGDRAAFAELYEFYAPRLKSYLRRLGATDVGAEELIQEVMLAVWRKAGLFDPRRAAAATWIFTIARNKHIDAIRREKRPNFDPHDPFFDLTPPLAADRVTELAYESERLQEALRKLPQDQASVVQLSYLEDKSHSAIADELDIPIGTVKSRLRLAFKRLRLLLGEEA